MSQKPARKRIVDFTPRHHEGEPYAAMIVHVQSEPEGRVNLVYWDEAGRPRAVMNVPVLQEPANQEQVLHGHYWSWPKIDRPTPAPGT